MQLNQLAKIKTKTKKRIGRGIGSGRGKTSGRGTKGQKARTRVKFLYEGGQLSLIKRLPLLRGKGKNKSREKSLIVNLKYLNLLPTGSIVDYATLIEHKIIKLDKKARKTIKILGDGDLKKKLIVKLPCSKGAVKKIIAAGGKVEATKKS